MSLRYGILGLLSKWDASGYDLKKEFDDFMSIFWHSHLSQIYPELNKLEKEQLITSKFVPQIGKPDKKIYSITEKGRKDLIEWLYAAPEKPKVKDSFLMQTFFMDNIPPDYVIFQLKTYQKEREQRLEKMKSTFKEKWNDIKARNVMKARILISSAVLKRGIEQEEQYIKWCEETIRLVEFCKNLWENNQEKEKVIPFSDVEPTFSEYLGDLFDED